MKKKIICVNFCLILFLIFTTLSFGEIDPKYVLREHPNQEPLLSAPKGDQFDDVLLLITPNWNRISLLIYIKIDSHDESPNSQEVKAQEVNFKLNSVRE